MGSRPLLVHLQQLSSEATSLNFMRSFLSLCCVPSLGAFGCEAIPHSAGQVQETNQGGVLSYFPWCSPARALGSYLASLRCGEKPAAPVPKQPESSSSSSSSSSDDGSSSEEDKGAPKPAGKASGREPQETVPAKSKAKAKARMDTAPKPKAKTKSAAKAKAKEPARPKVALLDTSDVKPDRFVKMRLDMAQDDAMAEASSSGVKRRRK